MSETGTFERFKNESVLIDHIARVNQLYALDKKALDAVRVNNIQERIRGSGLPCIELKKAVEALVNYFDSEFIQPNGSHSGMYYNARRFGYRFETVQADSFGPLRVKFKDGIYGWCVYYG